MQQSVDHSHHFNPSIDKQFSHEVSNEDVNTLFLTLERCVQLWHRYEDEVNVLVYLHYLPHHRAHCGI